MSHQREPLKLNNVLAIASYVLFLIACLVGVSYFQFAILMFGFALFCSIMAKLTDNTIPRVTAGSAIGPLFLIGLALFFIDIHRQNKFVVESFEKYLRANRCSYSHDQPDPREGDLDYADFVYHCLKDDDYITFPEYKFDQSVSGSKNATNSFWYRLKK